MCEVLAEINVLRTFTPADDVVCPLDAARVVLPDRSRIEHRELEILAQPAKIDHFGSSSRHRHVLRLRRGERRRRLALGLPRDRCLVEKRDRAQVGTRSIPVRVGKPVQRVNSRPAPLVVDLPRRMRLEVAHEMDG